eukprot:CAMPEP_0172727384 /NCGR_PEP_ID=MMETSP1074-20121228/91651_1 /TAXON_ID=2916 /ORGANISM="Ceratium fusus, Strain PA161109" /LENGTH=127 /DNA_ID=CAMNT_0013554529 /DNA_START=78 /DNA_END=458 /DNA_ORIENTATION=-
MKSTAGVMGLAAKVWAPLGGAGVADPNGIAPGSCREGTTMRPLAVPPVAPYRKAARLPAVASITVAITAVSGSSEAEIFEAGRGIPLRTDRSPTLQCTQSCQNLAVPNRGNTAGRCRCDCLANGKMA